MIDRLLHTPDGVRDTLNDECQKKQSLERELHKVLVSFGYRDLETPTFEFLRLRQGSGNHTFPGTL